MYIRFLYIFRENDDEVQSIPSMPGISRYGINKLKEHLEVVIRNGLKSILVFGVIEKLPKVGVQLTNLVLVKFYHFFRMKELLMLIVLITLL